MLNLTVCVSISPVLLLSRVAEYKGNRHGAVVSLPMWLGFNLFQPGAICGLSLLLVLILPQGVFSVSLPPEKLTFLNYSFTMIEDPHENQLELM